MAIVMIASLGLAAGCAQKKTEGTAAQAAKAIKGAIVFIEGSVTIDGSKAEIGQELGSKFLIETGLASSCDIVFDEKNAIRVSQNSVARLDLSGIRKQVRLEKGGFAAVLKKLQKGASDDSFRVDTGIASAGVRGTSFCVWTNEGESYICACNGSVHTIDSSGANEQTLTAAHHLAKLYSKQGSAILMSPAGLEYHDDAGLESLASRIGVKIDWSKPD
jgi:ferric-dicitrate binding protein FerR (iron transport regulator)